MNRKAFIMVLSIFSFLNLLKAQRSDSIPEIATIGDNKKIDRIAKRLIRKKKIPGLAISVVKNDTTIWQKGYGYANMEAKIPVDAKNTVFRIASVSKPLAATALAKMVLQNKIALDTSIYKYLPDFPRKKFDFTIRQLGGHLAGIRSYKGNEFLNNKPLSISQGVALFAKDPLLFQPGTQYLYNSYDWVLISEAMQQVANIPFEEYVKKEVLLPLNMHQTYPDATNINIANLARFYSRKRRRKFRKARKVNNFFKLAGGGYLSTSEDICKLGTAYLNNDFLTHEISSEFLTAQKVNEKSTYYGIGWEVSFDDKNRPFVGHTGNGVGGYALFRIYPEQQMVFAFLTNMTNPEVNEEFSQIINQFMDAEFPLE